MLNNYLLNKRLLIERIKTPYDATLLILDEEIINKLGVIKIEADEVNLSPKLLKDGGNNGI